MTTSKSAASKSALIAQLLDITVDAKMLLTAVQSVSRAVSSRASMPILQHLMLTATGDGTLTLSATDLERFISCSFPASDVLSPGQVTLPAKWITELLSRLPNSPARVTFDAVEGGASRSCRLKCSGSSYKVLGFDAEEFPCFPVTKAETTLTMKGAEFVHAIQSVDYACSKDESKAILAGALASFRSGDKPEIRLIATDTHRLSHAVCPVRHSSGEDHEIILPAEVLADIVALAKGASGITMGFVRNQANQTAMTSFEIAPNESSISFSITSRLIDGMFPNWQRVVPSGHDGTVLVAGCKGHGHPYPADAAGRRRTCDFCRERLCRHCRRDHS